VTAGADGPVSNTGAYYKYNYENMMRRNVISRIFKAIPASPFFPINRLFYIDIYRKQCKITRFHNRD
jgi:hypothetical protein